MTKNDKCWNDVLDNLFGIESRIRKRYIGIKWSIKGLGLGMSKDEAITKAKHEYKENLIKMLVRYCKLLRGL